MQADCTVNGQWMQASTTYRRNINAIWVLLVVLRVLSSKIYKKILNSTDSLVWKIFFAVAVSNIMLNQELQELRKVLQVCVKWKMKMSISHSRHWDIMLKCFICYWFVFLYRKFPIHWTNLVLRKPAVSMTDFRTLWVYPLH